MAYNIKLTQERQNLIKQFLIEDQDRKRTFAGPEAARSFIYSARAKSIGIPEQSPVQPKSREP